MLCEKYNLPSERTFETPCKCGFKNIRICVDGPFHDSRDFKIQRSDRNEKRRLRTEFAFFQSLSRLFLPTYFVECKRTLLNLNSKGPYPNSEREIKFRRYLFTFSIKFKIRHVHVVVVLKQQKNVQKFMMQVQSCCFAYYTYSFFCFFFTFSLRSRRQGHLTGHFEKKT